MDLRSIRYFICTAELGSVSRAAEKLNIVQPAMTRHIKRLERELGTTLLKRMPRGVQLTSTGREFLEHCRRIEQDVELALREVRYRRDVPRGPVALGASPTLGTVLMPFVIERALIKLPQVSLRVVEARSIKLHEALLTGELDLAILTNPVATHNLSLQRLTSETLCLVERAVGRSPESPISLDALARNPVVVTPGMRALASGDHGRKRIKLVLAAEIESIETIRCLVRAGLAKTIAPASTFRAELAKREVRATPIDAPDRHRDLVLACRIDDSDTLSIRELGRIISNEVKRRLIATKGCSRT
jgi:LysR family transcriptional regulator, nitrogen assimilation regulatory protein